MTLARELDVRARERLPRRDSLRMPTRLIDRRGAAARGRASTRGVVDVGLDDVDRRQQEQMPRARRGGGSARRRDSRPPTSAATTWRPTNRVPPRTTTARARHRQSVRAPRRRRASAAVPSPRGVHVPSRAVSGTYGWLSELRVEHRVGEHFLHVVAGLVERNRLDPDRALERRAGAPRLRAAGTRIVRSGRERRHGASSRSSQYLK